MQKKHCQGKKISTGSLGDEKTTTDSMDRHDRLLIPAWPLCGYETLINSFKFGGLSVLIALWENACKDLTRDICKSLYHSTWNKWYSHQSNKNFMLHTHTHPSIVVILSCLTFLDPLVPVTVSKFLILLFIVRYQRL